MVTRRSAKGSLRPFNRLELELYSSENPFRNDHPCSGKHSNQRITNLFAEERRKLLLERIEAAGTLSNAEVAETFNVSMLTIRRDLELLERDGLIRRIYGGAQHISVPLIEASRSTDFQQRAQQNLDLKERIGKLAAETVTDGETIFLDAGTTSLAMARALVERPLMNVRIVTHAVNIANEFAGYLNFRIFAIGGEIFEETRASTGQFTLDTIRRFSYDRYFIGCMGFDVQNGMTNARMPEVDVKNAVIERSNWVCLIADSMKWGVNAFAPIAPLERCHCVISDLGLNVEVQRKIRKLGIDLRLA